MVRYLLQGLQAEHFPLQHEPGGAAPQLHPLQGQPPLAAAAAASDGGQGQEQRDGGAPPTGGRIAARIRVKHLMTPGKTPDLSVVITGVNDLRDSEYRTESFELTSTLLLRLCSQNLVTSRKPTRFTRS